MTRQLEKWADQIEAGLAQEKIAAVVTGGTVKPTRIVIDVVIADPLPPRARLAEWIGAALDRDVSVVLRPGGIRVVMVLPGQNDVDAIIDQYSGQIPPACAVLGLRDDGGPLLLRIPAINVQHTLILGPQGRELLRAACYGLAATNRPEHLQIANFRLNQWGQAGQPLDQTLAAVVTEIDRRERDGAGLPVLIVAIPELAKADPDCITRILWRGAGVGVYCFAATAANKSPGVFRTVIWWLDGDRYQLTISGEASYFSAATVQRRKQGENKNGNR